MRGKILKFLLVLFLLFSIFILVYNSTHEVKLEAQKININTATIEELNTLPLVGEKKAQYIMEYRQTKGNFKSIEELDSVKGIGEKTIEALKNYAEVK